MRVGLGRAPCGSGGVRASWATRGVSRPGGEEGETWAALGRLGPSGEESEREKGWAGLGCCWVLGLVLFYFLSPFFSKLHPN